MTHQVTLVTAPDQTVAKELAESLIEQQLAACVNIIQDVSSVYRWAGEVTWSDEVLLVIKADAARADVITAHVLAHHPYENPEVIHLPVSGGSQKYLDWLSD